MRGLKSERALALYFHKNKEVLLADSKVNKLYQKYNTIKDYKKGCDHLYSIVEAFCKKYNRLPTVAADNGSRRAKKAYTYLRNHCKDDEKLYNLRVKYSGNGRDTKGAKSIEIVKNFVEEHCYLPFSAKFGDANSAWNRLRYYYSTNSEIQSFVAKMNSEYLKTTREMARKNKINSAKKWWALRKNANT